MCVRSLATSASTLEPQKGNGTEENASKPSNGSSKGSKDGRKNGNTTTGCRGESEGDGVGGGASCAHSEEQAFNMQLLRAYDEVKCVMGACSD